MLSGQGMIPGFAQSVSVASLASWLYQPHSVIYSSGALRLKHWPGPFGDVASHQSVGMLIT